MKRLTDAAEVALFLLGSACILWLGWKTCEALIFFLESR